MVHRREFLMSVGGALAAAAIGEPLFAGAASSPKRNRLGVCSDSFALRRRQEGDAAGPGARLTDPLGFLAYCHDLGAGGIQAEIGTRDEPYASRLRIQAEEWGLFVEASIRLPKDKPDLERFEAEVGSAEKAGAKVLRAVLPSQGSGRRYEAYASADEFRQVRKRGQLALELAEPVVARRRLRLAVENHKDERVAERLETLKSLGSEYVGVCVDTGNDLSFLEDPMEVVEAYAPWAFSVHLKDMAVAEYDDGFLLAEVPLGEGLLDLPRVVQVLRSRHPEVQFCLEMMTRDPLKIPCLTDRYWAAMGDLPGRNLARTLRIVRTRGRNDLPRVSQLSPSEQIQVEDANVRKCLAYAAGLLG